MAKVELTDDAKSDLRGLDRSVQIQILKGLKKLESSPSQRGAPLGSKSTGNLTGYRKLYVGPKKAYRAVYVADGDKLAVVLVVAEREDQVCYEMALARIRLLPPGDELSEVARLLASVSSSDR